MSTDGAGLTAGTPAATPAVVARGVRLRTRRGVVYGPVDLDIPEGTLAVVQGPQGGGRSSLLLTLAGRMVPDSGCTLRVLGETLPAAAPPCRSASPSPGSTGSTTSTRP
ncbi:hypothetical protein [Cellulomonas soli]